MSFNGSVEKDSRRLGTRRQTLILLAAGICSRNLTDLTCNTSCRATPSEPASFKAPVMGPQPLTLLMISWFTIGPYSHHNHVLGTTFVEWDTCNRIASHHLRGTCSSPCEKQWPGFLTPSEALHICIESVFFFQNWPVDFEVRVRFGGKEAGRSGGRNI